MSFWTSRVIEELIEALWNHVLDFSLPGGQVEQLSRGLQHVDFLCGFSSDVVNGGIEQFIGNRCKAQIGFTIRSLHKIGAL